MSAICTQEAKAALDALKPETDHQKCEEVDKL